MSIVKLNDRAVKDATTFGSISSLGEMVFISKATASASASIEFSLGDYKEYQFYFVNIHPSVDSAHFSFHGSTNGGTSYSLNHVSTAFRAIHDESGSNTALQYHSDDGGTAQFGLHNEDRFNIIASYVGADNDQTCAGYLHLFNPSSTTFVKHWTSHFSIYNANDYHQNNFHAGYMNTISAINSIKFKFANGTGGDNGNIDAGEILLFGIN